MRLRNIHFRAELLLFVPSMLGVLIRTSVYVSKDRLVRDIEIKTIHIGVRRYQIVEGRQNRIQKPRVTQNRSLYNEIPGVFLQLSILGLQTRSQTTLSFFRGNNSSEVPVGRVSTRRIHDSHSTGNEDSINVNMLRLV
jgi:hypothetical protein